MTQSVLITGANRGLGLEFTRQFAKNNFTVFACCRDPDNADELNALQNKHQNIQLFSLEISSMASIQLLQKEITQPIDILLNNAGILEEDPAFGALSIENFSQSFLVNAVSPLKVTEAFKENLAKSSLKLVVCITSRIGSISENHSGGYYSYRTSKTALNMLMKTAAFDLALEGIRVLLLHPGWVKTRMGGTEAALTPTESVSGMIKVITNYQTIPPEVMFYNYKGEEIPW